LHRFALEDAALVVNEEKETGRIMLSGQGELHLDIILERLRKEYGLRIHAGNPQVPKIERLRKSIHIDETYTGDFGGERITVAFGFLSRIKAIWKRIP